eukprot:CAMPEP_0170627602 /NCGR_PEP_ID=MMETSP0224-20130122/32068_1 /TAXON_ID=285029 /ORGANISM="Togula jolla, Strain CCCM 725" /LENGTH=60 /DNA_ID=CAMNT_0010954631 /DNA_START=278 /DNA_END=460 /DNA_ORIENTATION=+
MVPATLKAEPDVKEAPMLRLHSPRSWNVDLPEAPATPSQELELILSKEEANANDSRGICV